MDCTKTRLELKHPLVVTLVFIIATIVLFLSLFLSYCFVYNVLLTLKQIAEAAWPIVERNMIPIGVSGITLAFLLLLYLVLIASALDLKKYSC
jgi:heme/copper-type cytochrome/quinol oxidase subunit 3